MFNSLCLLNNMYEYYEYQMSHRSIKGVVLITDKQSVFYAGLDNNKFINHADIYFSLANGMYPSYNGEREDLAKKGNSMVIINADGGYFQMFMPDNHNFSSKQYNMVKEVLVDLNKVNSMLKNKNINVTMHGTDINGNSYDLDTPDIDNILNFLDSQIVDNKEVDNEENIIGVPYESIVNEDILKKKLEN